MSHDLSWLEGRPVFASISGGKDSTALGLWLMDQGIPFTPIFLDTGWEHPETYSYISQVLAPLFGEFKILKNERYFKDLPGWRGGMEQLIRKKKMFPSGVVKFCTSELKVIPIQNFYAELRAELGVKPINALGIRAEESLKRSKMTEIEEQDEATVWRPLIRWTEAEIIELHHKHSIPPNPLYLRGASRVGCYPCIYARKHEIRHLALSDPERIEYIESLEREVNALRPEGSARATFFKSKRKDREPMGILDIVKWAQSERRLSGTVDDLEDIEDQGCMRWGLCEHPSAQSPARRSRGQKQLRLFQGDRK